MNGFKCNILFFHNKIVTVNDVFEFLLGELQEVFTGNNLLKVIEDRLVCLAFHFIAADHSECVTAETVNCQMSMQFSELSCFARELQHASIIFLISHKKQLPCISLFTDTTTIFAFIYLFAMKPEEGKSTIHYILKTERIK